LAGCGPARVPRDEGDAAPIKIGALTSSSGRTAFIGRPEAATLERLTAEINAAGGVDGHRLELLLRDTGGEAERAVHLAHQLVSDPDVIALIGPSTTAESLAVIPAVGAARIPEISLAAGVEIVQPVRPWVFKDTPSDTHAVGRIYDYLSRREIQRIAIICADDPFGEGGEVQLREQAPVFGMRIARSFTFHAEAPDEAALAAFMAGLASAKPRSCDALVVWGTDPGPAMIVRLARRDGLRIPIVNSHGIASRQFIEQAGPAAEGVLFPASPLLVCESLDWNHPLRAVEVQYKRWYEDRFHEAPSAFGGHAWDALSLVREGLRATLPMTRGRPSRTKLRAWLEETRNFPGTGGIYHFSPSDHNGLSRDAFVMIRIEDGRWVLEP
jgi:branched-chain amino acid transport system substrate-binding protein